MSINSWKDYLKKTVKDKFAMGGTIAGVDTSFISWGQLFKGIAASYCDTDAAAEYMKEGSKTSFFSIVTAKIFNPFLHLQNLSGLIQICIAKGVDYLLPGEEDELLESKNVDSKARIIKQVTTAPFRVLTTGLGPIAHIEKSPVADAVNKGINKKLYGSELSPAANKVKKNAII